MRRGCTPNQIIKRPDGRETVVHYDGDTQDIINTILWADGYADRYINKGAAQCLRGKDDYETARNVWNFVKRNLTYWPDQPGHERVKSPGALFHNKKGDCKSYSLAAAAILRALGVRGVHYRFAAYDGNKNYTHVYVVIDQPGNQKPIIVDAVHSKFDDEVYWSKAVDYAATGKRAAVSGTPAVNGTFSDIMGIAIAFGIVWAFKSIVLDK